MSQAVLVTGSSGGVGRTVCKELEHAGHAVTGFDLSDVDAAAPTIVGDILDRDAVRTALAGKDAVIHLAATPDEADFIEELIEPNVRGLFHVADGARIQNVPRLVLTSSVQVVSGHSFAKTIRLEDGPRVVNHYALTKLWAEDLGDMYARVHGMQVIAARLGWLPRSLPHAQELRASPIGTDVYLSHTDAGRFFRACIEAEMSDGQFEIFFATSQPKGKRRIDLSRTTEVIGFEPQDTWPQGQPFLTEPAA
jgi:uronate dehydrogenase